MTIIIPLFPLNGVIFFPNSHLPLNIFEEKYLEMIDYSLSTNRLIGMIQFNDNKFYKIGYSSTSVQDRIKNAENETTYLMAPVEIESSWICYNMNALKFEQLIQRFFGHTCVEIDVFDKKGIRHTPREWFIVPLEAIEQAIILIISFFY